MKCKILLIVLLLGSTLFNAAIAQTISGKWNNEDKNSIIEIYKNGTKYFGKILSSKTKEYTGYVMLKDFQDKGNGVYEEGKLVNPKNGKTYDCKLTLKGDILNVKVTAMMGIGKTLVWTRAK